METRMLIVGTVLHFALLWGTAQTVDPGLWWLAVVPASVLLCVTCAATLELLWAFVGPELRE